MNEKLNLDTDTSNKARALHRVVRAMHDAACPACGHLGENFKREYDYQCPKCGFLVTYSEACRAMEQFRDYSQESVMIFNKWVGSGSPDSNKEEPKTDREFVIIMGGTADQRRETCVYWEKIGHTRNNVFGSRPHYKKSVMTTDFDKKWVQRYADEELKDYNVTLIDLDKPQEQKTKPKGLSYIESLLADGWLPICVLPHKTDLDLIVINGQTCRTVKGRLTWSGGASYKDALEDDYVLFGRKV